MDFLNDLNLEQRRAVTHPGGPLLILAGAGSGKTRCLTYRVAWLMSDQLVDPSRILLLTFTNKAAGEMKSRVKTLLNHQPSTINHQLLPWAGTFHSWCAWILRKHAGLAELKESWVIYDENDKESLIKEVISDLDLAKTRFRPRAVGAVISDAKNELIGATEYPQFARGEWYEGVARIYLEYQRRLKQFGGVDFDDLLVWAVKMFERQEGLRTRYQERIQHLLVDEYQDTNTAQYRLTRILAGRHQNLTAVGDFSQAIYQFRGANYKNLLQLQRDFRDLTTMRLEQNYRSHQSILDAAHQVISNNTQHPVLKLWTDKKSLSPVKLHVAISEIDEAMFVTQAIEMASLKKNGELRHRDFAVLYRTNAQSRVFEEAMLSAGLPYILVGGIQFYQRAEVKDCLAYLRLLYNPDDKMSETRVLKLGKQRYVDFREYARKSSRASPSDGRSVAISEIATSPAVFQKQRGPRNDEETRQLLEGVLKATRYLERFDDKDPEDQVRIENVKELMSVAEAYPKLGSFLEQVALVERETLVQKENRDGVRLMTLHAAKGLEFRQVFLVGLEEGLLPHSRSMGKQEDLEEERRLMYVGVTRAMDELVLSYARSRLVFGARGVAVPSRFIGEIGEERLERI
jgi:DNA helicase-2/ATP-dependent DNA helicase PcrA